MIVSLCTILILTVYILGCIKHTNLLGLKKVKNINLVRESLCLNSRPTQAILNNLV